MKKQKTLILIIGPTAIGKTSLSIELAKHFNTAILSVDSRQLYKEMSIGTAKPSIEERAGIPHYFIDSHSIHQEYTTGQYESDFLQKAKKLFEEKDILVAVGGSGLFVKAICHGFDDIPSDINVRNQIMQRLEDEGIASLQEELKQADPRYYESNDIQNTHRLVRALEVFALTQQPISSFQTGNKKERDFNIIKVGLTLEREELYKRINLRVDQMIDMGLLKEIETLLPHKQLNALQTVGYQEFWEYFENKRSLEESIELVKRNTRRFAKRQLTWFKKEEDTHWLTLPDAFERVLSYIHL